MKNVLFIVMEFAPVNIAGVHRPLRFINALSRSGVHPIVVTIEIDENFKRIQEKFDYDLLSRIERGVTVIRIPAADISRYSEGKISSFFNVYWNRTDNFLKAWKKNFYREIYRIIDRFKPEAVITTCPPFSSAVLGRDVSKEFGLPLILDMRDAWAKASIALTGSCVHHFGKVMLERSCFRQASKIVTVTPQLKRQFASTHPRMDPGKLEVIYNSFDCREEGLPAVRAAPISEKEEIHIGYAGSYYYNPKVEELLNKSRFQRFGHRMLQYTPEREDWRYRSPFFFFRTLTRLFEKRPEWRGKVLFHHVGVVEGWLREMTEAAGLSSNVVFHGYKPKGEAQELLRGFDYLLATSEKVIEGEHYCLPSKLFSYILTGKPILAFVTKGIQEEFVRSGGLGVVFDPDDTFQAAERMATILEQGWTSVPDSSYLRRYRSDVTDGRFVEIVEEILD